MKRVYKIHFDKNQDIRPRVGFYDAAVVFLTCCTQDELLSFRLMGAVEDPLTTGFIGCSAFRTINRWFPCERNIGFWLVCPPRLGRQLNHTTLPLDV